MFCDQCGAKADNKARFCSTCGKSLSFSSTNPQNTVSTRALPSDKQMLSFGKPIAEWWGPFKGNGPFPKGYEWLEQRNTLFVCRNHIVLLKGHEKQSEAMAIIEAMGLVGGVVAGIRCFKDFISSKKFEFSNELITPLFDKRLLVWCKMSDAVIWRYHEKPWLFIKSSSEQLYCKFNSQAGIIHACYTLWCTAEYSGRAKGTINEFSCKIVDAGHNLPENKVLEAMKSAIMNLPSY